MKHIVILMFLVSSHSLLCQTTLRNPFAFPQDNNAPAACSNSNNSDQPSNAQPEWEVVQQTANAVVVKDSEGNIKELSFTSKHED
jgi:hypothetical protein